MPLVIAFGAGLASFLSPCIVPLVPAYLSSLAGTALGSASRPRLFGHALAFVVGLAAFLVASGLAATSFGLALRSHARLLSDLGGVVLVVFGLELLGVIRLGILNRTAAAQPPSNPASLGGAFGLGVVFAAGWTPCIGPVLAGILILAARASSVQAGALLLLAYTAGLAVPFLAVAALLDRALAVLRRLAPWLPWANRGAGALLALLGLSLITGWYAALPGLI
jgi:cytochrome c-type biogenesis protein